MQNTFAQEPPLLTREQAATHLGISGQTLWRWQKAGLITPIKKGLKKVLYNQADLDKIDFTKPLNDQ